MPSQSWADMVFPNEPKEARIEKLWEAIFYTLRIMRGKIPVAAWKKHDETLHKKVDYLNHEKI